MMRTTFFALVMQMVLFCGSAAAENALMLETKIPLGDVRGRNRSHDGGSEPAPAVCCRTRE